MLHWALTTRVLHWALTTRVLHWHSPPVCCTGHSRLLNSDLLTPPCLPWPCRVSVTNQHFENRTSDFQRIFFSSSLFSLYFKIKPSSVPYIQLPTYAFPQRHRHRPSQGTGFAVSSGMLTVPWSTALGVVLGRSFTSSCDQTLSLLLARGFLESRGGTSHFCCGAETPVWSASARFRAVPGHMC